MTHSSTLVPQPTSLARWESEGGAVGQPGETPVAGLPLQPYALYFLDRIDFPVLRQEFVAVDDSAAIAHALAFCKTHVVEIFQDKRIISRIPKGSLGMGPIERLDPQSSTERVL